MVAPSLGPGGAFLMLCAYLGYDTRARFKESMTICFQNLIHLSTVFAHSREYHLNHTGKDKMLETAICQPQ